MPTPILFFGDSPDLNTGLGRIGRNLAVLTSQLPEFRVGYLGRAGHGSRQLPFVQYNFSEREQWGELNIERAWTDFAGEERGIIFTIWDASRLHWFSRPAGLPQQLHNFLNSRRFDRWGYFPVDAKGVGGKLTAKSADTLNGYNRVLAYTIFGSQVLSDTLGCEVEWIPHGLGDAFQPRERTPARMSMGFPKNSKMVGVVMTNQARKDWGLAFATMAELRRRDPAFEFWLHVDVMERSNAWSLNALRYDYGLADHVKITMSGSMTDEQLSYAYSGCDVTMLPSLGEGFGYPLVESMACGTPAIHGNYAGGAELVPREHLVEPVSWRLESLHNCLRPVYNPNDWADKVMEVALSPMPDLVNQVEHLRWKNLWPAAWKKWMLEGIGA